MIDTHGCLRKRYGNWYLLPESIITPFELGEVTARRSYTGTEYIDAFKETYSQYRIGNVVSLRKLRIKIDV